MKITSAEKMIPITRGKVDLNRSFQRLRHMMLKTSGKTEEGIIMNPIIALKTSQPLPTEHPQ